jgi:hypothetical protein
MPDNNPSTANVAANMGLGTQPGNSGVRVGVLLGNGAATEQWFILLEDDSGFVALEDGTGNILLEAAP